jgi:hypothetical protein
MHGTLIDKFSYQYDQIKSSTHGLQLSRIVHYWSSVQSLIYLNCLVDLVEHHELTVN